MTKNTNIKEFHDYVPFVISCSSEKISAAFVCQVHPHPLLPEVKCFDAPVPYSVKKSHGKKNATTC
jgi:hypothetical protein